MGVFAGTGQLLRLALRRDRSTLPLWGIAIVGLLAAMIPALKEAYPGTIEQATYMQLLDTSAIGRLFAGTPNTVDFAAVVMAETALYIGLAVAFMSALLVIRHTRYNEELGSSELLQSARVGRYAALTSALVLAAIMNGLVAIGLALVLQDVDGITSAQAWAYGVGQGLVGVSFAALAGVAAQVADTSRGANGLIALAVGVAFLLRGIGDIFATQVNGEYIPLWTSWLSPFGWLQQAQPLGETRWWLFGAIGLFVIGVTMVSYVLLARRDIGSGLWAARKGRARASRGLLVAAPLGLAVRLQKGILIGWAIGAGAFALIVGGIADQVGDLIEESEVMQQYLAGLGGTTTAVESMLSAMLAIIMLLVGAYIVQALGRARSEEVSGRLESLLSTSLGRTRWLLSHIIVVAMGTLGITALAGAVVAITAGIVMAAPVGDWQVGAYILAAVSYTPALLVFAGITVFGIGVFPRVALGMGWLAFAMVALINQLGALLKLPDWLKDLSPLSHVAVAPSEDVAWQPLVILFGVALCLTIIGLIAFRYRDIATT